MFPIAGRAQDNVCRSQVCKEVAAVFDQTVSQSVKPCQDFFTYVCSGWMENVKKNLGSKPGKKRLGTLDAMTYEVRSRVILKELLRLRSKADEKLRDSELQPVTFFKSCLRSIRKTDQDLNTMTLRKFFHEVGLPFFDEKLDTNDDCAKKSPLASLLKLALQFGVYPLFRLYLKDNQINVFKEDYTSRDADIWNETPKEVARDWKFFLRRSLTQANDSYILVTLGALLDAYNIRAPEKDILTWGQNYEAVMKGYKEKFYQFKNFTSQPLSALSESASSTYFDLLDQHTGNLLPLEEHHRIAFYPSYFEPMLISLRDKDLAPMYTDFIRVYLLKETLPDLIGRTSCSLKGEQCFWGSRQPVGQSNVKYCATVVSAY